MASSKSRMVRALAIVGLQVGIGGASGVPLVNATHPELAKFLAMFGFGSIPFTIVWWLWPSLQAFWRKHWRRKSREIAELRAELDALKNQVSVPVDRSGTASPEPAAASILSAPWLSPFHPPPLNELFRPPFEVLSEPGNLTSVTPGEILRKIAALPLAAQKQYAAEFAGMRGQWSFTVQSVADAPFDARGACQLLLNYKSYFVSATIERDSKVALLNHDTAVTVEGIVAAVSNSVVYLSPAKIVSIDG